LFVTVLHLPVLSRAGWRDGRTVQRRQLLVCQFEEQWLGLLSGHQIRLELDL
jgi:hypothetical protein